MEKDKFINFNICLKESIKQSSHSRILFFFLGFFLLGRFFLLGCDLSRGFGFSSLLNGLRWSA